MLDTKIYNFEEVLKYSVDEKKRNLLMGNGFSVALDKDIFTYDSLLNKSSLGKCSPHIKEVFSAMNTSDFELIIKILQSSNKVAKCYGVPEDICNLILSDSENLKTALIESISSLHPGHQGLIPPEFIKNCIKFLKNFSSFYTLNYDLLLYWVLLNSSDIKYNDAFAEKIPELSWVPAYIRNQSIFYLHGALHLFPKGFRLTKLVWENEPLIVQIIDNIAKNNFPLFVAESESSLKYDRIRDNQYLKACNDMFSKITEDLFIFGFSFKDNDLHIINSIKDNIFLKNIFISVHKDLENDNPEMLARCNEIKDYRDSISRSVNIMFFEASSAHVWH